MIESKLVVRTVRFDTAAKAQPAKPAPLPTSHKKLFLLSDIERIRWTRLEEPLFIQLNWRYACVIIRRKRLASDLSPFSALYADFIKRLERLARDKLVATGSRPKGMARLREVATGLVQGEESWSFIRCYVWGREFVLPQSFADECKPAIADLSPQ